MDFNKLIARVKAILLTPKTEWPVIAEEPATVGSLYTGYIMVLALIPAVFSFIKNTVLGVSVPLLGTYHVSMAAGLTSAVIRYVLTLVGAYIVAFIVDALAPTFGGQKNRVQALKVVAYAYTASWVASIGYIVPGLYLLILLAGGIYGIYLLYLGLPPTMKCPPEKATGYTVVTIIVAIIVMWIIGIVIGMVGYGSGVLGSGGALGNFGASSGFSSPYGGSGTVTVDPDSAAGKLQQWSAGLAAASKQMETAQKSGDNSAQGAAVGKLVAAAIGGNAQVEALSPDRLKPFLPDTLGGLKRVEASAERNSALGMQVAEAKARYADDAGQHSLDLDITDMGGAKGLMAFAGWAGVEQEKETQNGFEKTFKDGDRITEEKWDGNSKQGEYATVIGERFSVKVSGGANSVDDLKAVVAGLNLAGLEALKNEGVHPN